MKLLCPFCNAEMREELYNSVYGCDTGCEYIKIKIECDNCKKVTWDSGTFGSYENNNEKDEYRENFMEEFANELNRIAADRLKGNK